MQSFYTLNKPQNKLDVTIVEASAITEDGGIIPGASVGASPELIQMADKIIIEVNTAASIRWPLMYDNLSTRLSS